jgi:integrase
MRGTRRGRGHITRRGRGSIRQRGKASWELKFDVGTVNGKRQTRYATVHGTYKDAQRELTRLLNAVDTDTLLESTAITLEQYLNGWLNHTHEQAPKTLERYGQLAAKQIIPHLGAAKLQKLKPEHVQAWHRTLLDSGLSPRTIGHAHRLLSKVLNVAVKNGTLTRNVASVHRPPSAEDTELETLTREQAADVLTALEGHTLLPIVSLALASGMRRGELLGLQWGDIDLDSGTLRVERAIEETGAGLRLKPPKTKRGRRSISLPVESVTMLRAHKVQQMELRLLLGQGPIKRDTLVFSNVDGGLLRPRNVSKAWWRLVSVSFHSLRHTHVSMLIRAGVDILTISRRLGHSKAATTLDVYGHLIGGADEAAAKAMESLLK